MTTGHHSRRAIHPSEGISVGRGREKLDKNDLIEDREEFSSRQAIEDSYIHPDGA